MEIPNVVGLFACLFYCTISNLCFVDVGLFLFLFLCLQACWNVKMAKTFAPFKKPYIYNFYS